jgi:hypothetical protein
MAYEYFKQFEPHEWEAVTQAIRELAANQDLKINTTEEHVVGYICKTLRGYDAPEVYDPNFGDDRECVCGHPYHRHFDSYEDMKPVGCKYSGQCGCEGFEEAEPQTSKSS